MGLLKKLWNNKWILFYFPFTLFFNFKYLPFRQAVKIPILLYKPKIRGKGKYIIQGETRTGMIRMGQPLVSVYRQGGVVLENNGTVIFKGNALFGGGSAISVGASGVLEIGNHFSNQYHGIIICYYKIKLGECVRLGWDCLICDTDFHKMKSIDNRNYSKGYGEIIISDYVWVASFCKFYKNTFIPPYCTVAANTLLNKHIDCEPYSIISSTTGIKTKYVGMYRDINDDTIDYISEEK